uniref:hypothetical protein n=1 Tax=uncultured Erythrobacter sp. TaxID=263913 RepID=UPI002604C273|nr:hypothetical protein [uncultured Erythrobacter sp.]
MRVTITKQHRDKLKQEAKRTGTGPSKLLRGKRGIAPEGLTSSMIHAWRNGTIKTARDEHLDWVFKAYAGWSLPPKTKALQKITLTDEHRTLIQSEMKRTGLGAVAILKHAGRPLPDGLNHQKVQRWTSGETRTAVKVHWELVVRLYASVKADQ